jgi:hypothetical protein
MHASPRQSPDPGFGEERVARFFGRETCFGVIAVLSAGCRDTSQIVP